MRKLFKTSNGVYATLNDLKEETELQKLVYELEMLGFEAREKNNALQIFNNSNKWIFLKYENEVVNESLLEKVSYHFLLEFILKNIKKDFENRTTELEKLVNDLREENFNIRIKNRTLEIEISENNWETLYYESNYKNFKITEELLEEISYSEVAYFIKGTVII